jgi:hypothetical protein
MKNLLIGLTAVVILGGCAGQNATTPSTAPLQTEKIRNNGDISELPLGVDVDKARDVPFAGVELTRGQQLGQSYIYEGQYLNGQCVTAMQAFYSGRFGIAIGYPGGNLGAYNFGLPGRTIANMDRLPGGSPTRTHDLVIFDHNQGSGGMAPYGHMGTVASSWNGGRSVTMVDSNWVAGNTGGAHQVDLNTWRILCIYRPRGIYNHWPTFARQGWDADVKYRGHFQDIGDFSEVNMGEILGTTGHGLRQEAVRITSANRNIYYKVHVANIGWMPTVSNGALAGTTGQGLQMEAIQIWADHGTVEYYVHVQNIGWMGPFYNGQTAGTTGQGLRIEAMAVHVTDAGAWVQPKR